MNYSEFIRQLGADPASSDPEFLRARNSAPEFIVAAADSDRFEFLLNQAMNAGDPRGLVDELKCLTDLRSAAPRQWRNYAIAASMLLAVVAAGITWQINHSWDSVEQYVEQHYGIDGPDLLIKGEGKIVNDPNAYLARFDTRMSAELAAKVSLIKHCPTPDGKGAHIVLNTSEGALTVIFMPDTAVTDGETMVFGNMEALLVSLNRGSAVIIGSNNQHIANFRRLVQNGFITSAATA